MDTIPTDKLYAQSRKLVDAFKFDEQVTQVFSDMISRSVPGYHLMLDLLAVLTEQTMRDGDLAYDLGCSLGASTLAMRQNITADNCQIIALDNSEDMLKKAKNEAFKHALDNIQFILGDTQHFLTLQDGQHLNKVDAVVMNMVLHHIPTPAKVFKDISHFLNNNGVLVICELSHHNQEWTKENCGDIWLGFETEELTKWAKQAHFKADKTVFIGLRNGFQIQVRKFIKIEQMQ